ncbi:MAG: hypothetical protein K2G93_00620 [Rikenella sp.]|nr:hypothetical protein [Rikenella sp.]
MKCESCRTRDAVREVSKTTEDCPEACGPAYRLCAECAERLENYALRPAEFFNLAAIHGHGYYLHDDFYDWENGRAEQPEIRMTDVRKFPFPSFKNVMTDPARLLDYAIVQGFPSERAIARLRQCNKQELLGIIRRKVAYNPELLEEVDDLVARVIGREAEEWVREVWQNRQPTETIES